jgi:hypothetical protein
LQIQIVINFLFNTLFVLFHFMVLLKKERVVIDNQMGHIYNNGESSYFDSLDVNNESCAKFDLMLKLIKFTDVFEKDTAQFMREEPRLLTPVYSLCHEEIFMLMWYAKYAQNKFLPERWSITYYSDNNMCNMCSPNKKVSEYLLKKDQCYCFECDTHKFDSYTDEDCDVLREIIFNLSNYCFCCRRPLYNIVDVEDDNRFFCLC